MLPRVALPFVRLPSLPVPTLRVRAIRRTRVGRPSARSLVFAAGIAAGCALLYVLARESSVFAVRTVSVAGAEADVSAQVRHALRPLEGESLVALDTASVERRVTSLPTVRGASVDRAFPHRLTVRVVPERALAVYRDGPHAWLVAESGRVIAPLEPSARPRLPRIRAELPVPPATGERLATAEAALVIDALAALPRQFPARVLYATVDEGTLALVVADRLEIRLGDGADLGAKLAAVAAVLRSLSADERAALGYLDAAVPGRIVASSNTQL